MLVGRPLQEEYPQYAGFTFIDVMGAAAQAGIRNVVLATRPPPVAP